MAEQDRNVTMKGEPLSLAGNEVSIGEAAPDFTALDTELNEVTQKGFEGQVTVYVTVPSLDTSVCDAEARRFNEEAAKLGDDVSVVVISCDLPFAQDRWCAAKGVDNVTLLSDHRDLSFGKAYGLLVEDLRLLARCVLVVDRRGFIRYKQLVGELTNEPDYDAVLEAVREVAAPE